MVLATSNKARRLLSVRCLGQVQADELAQSEADIRALVAELPPDFRTLMDLSQLEEMDLDCTRWIGRILDRLHESGVSVVVRVVPDPAKDLAPNMLAVFNHRHHPQMVHCKDILEAAQHLA
jgi:hypothetical protein